MDSPYSERVLRASDRLLPCCLNARGANTMIQEVNMKRLLVIVLSLAMAGCAAIAPTPLTPVPTSTAQTVLQTVVVTVLVTQVVTVTPSSTPTATLTPIPTFTPAGTGTAQTPTGATSAATASTPGTPAPAASTPGEIATATLPPDVGGGLFTNFTRSSDHFALRCQPDSITFGVSTTNPDVTEVDLFYRMEDQLSSSISGWIDIGKMSSDQAGNFTYSFPASLVDPDLRSHKAWFDYQFVGISKAGQVLGRSGRILQQITFTIDCP